MQKMLTVCDRCQRPGTHDDELMFRNKVQHGCDHVYCENCMVKARHKGRVTGVYGNFTGCPICLLNDDQKEYDL